LIEIYNDHGKDTNKKRPLKTKTKKNYVGWLIWLGIFGILYYLGIYHFANRNFILFIGILLFLSFFLVIMFYKDD